MKKTNWFALSLVGIAAVLIACRGVQPMASTPAEPLLSQEVSVAGGSYFNITAVQLEAMLGQKDFLFINVHIPYDGEIAGTDLFLPYDQVELNQPKLPSDKGAKIVVYCRSGNMSAFSAEALVALGYIKVWNLRGGMMEWQQEGYPLIHKPQ